MNYNIRIDLMKLRNVEVEEVSVGGRSRPCVCIPLEDNAGPVKLDGGSCYLSLTAFELKDPNRGQSHFLKINLPSEMLFGMTRAGILALPYIGNMRPWAKPATDRCKICPFSSAARYSSGGYFTRCEHPDADMCSTRDVARMKECPRYSKTKANESY